MKQLQMIDSAGEITDSGLALYNIGLVNGPTSKVFTDYFIKEVLTTGHHLDVLLDIDSMKNTMPMAPITSVFNAVEVDYMIKGLLKFNPGRTAGPAPTVGFLKYEKISWKALGLVDASYNIQWRKITEECSLPEVY